MESHLPNTTNENSEKHVEIISHDKVPSAVRNRFLDHYSSLVSLFSKMDNGGLTNNF